MKSKTILSYKTETSGLPLWRERSLDERQPHLVRLSAILFNAETEKVISKMDELIKPDGWEIPQETIDIHNITNEQAIEEGIEEKMAIEMFIKMCGDSDCVSSNKQFNNRIMRIALKRFATEEEQEKWAKKERHHCAMKMAKDDIGDKKITLTEALTYYCDSKIVDNHQPLLNAKSAASIFFAINRKNQLKGSVK